MDPHTVSDAVGAGDAGDAGYAGDAAVDFGGDMRVDGPRTGQQPVSIGCEWLRSIFLSYSEWRQLFNR